MKPKSKRRGLTIVEVLVALALAATFMVGIYQLSSVGIQSGNLAKVRSAAIQLASEAMEGMYVIRQNDGICFTSTGCLTGTTEYYQPISTGGTWSLGTKRIYPPYPPIPTSLSGTSYDRTVKIEAARRYMIGFACTGALTNETGGSTCADDDTRKITVSVSWSERGVAKNYTLTSILTNL